MTLQCARCNDTGWVCEAHPDRPWKDEHGNECCGEPGMPCPDCNSSRGTDDPPDVSRIMDVRYRRAP